MGSSLQSAANQGEDCGDEKTVDTANLIGYPTTDEGTNDGTEIVLQIELVTDKSEFKIARRLTMLTMPP